VTRAADVIVVGAGIVGAAVASAAAAEGLQVLIVSDGVPGDGATAAGMGHLVVLDDDPAELALSAYSMGLWRAFCGDTRAQYHACGTLWIANDDGEVALLATKQARLAQAGIASQWLTGDDVVRVEPALRPGLAAGLRVASDAAVYAPAVAADLVARVCREHGARLQSARVTALRPRGVVLDDGSVTHAGAVIVAAGLATRALLPELPFVPRKGHLAITDRFATAPLSHQVVEVGYGASAHGSRDSVAFNVQPRPTGQLLIGSCRQVGRDDHTIDAAMLGRMTAHALRFLPALASARVLRAWSGVRPGTRDGRPYIGRWPLLDGTWVAAGHEGLGVTTALGTARLVVDQLLGRATAIDASPFDPARALAEATT
jgi:glycine/D-amino acid oxidase-like deaminating enzyme